MELDDTVLKGFKDALDAQEQRGMKEQIPNVDWPTIGLHDECPLVREQLSYVIVDECQPYTQEDLSKILERLPPAAQADLARVTRQIQIQREQTP